MIITLMKVLRTLKKFVVLRKNNQKKKKAYLKELLNILIVAFYGYQIKINSKKKKQYSKFKHLTIKKNNEQFLSPVKFSVQLDGIYT